MSNVLQRLIDRTRAPLSPVQPILPSIYTPADRSENDAGPMIQTEVAGSSAQSSQYSPQQAGKRESSDAALPISGRPVAPAPTHPEAGAPPYASATTPLSPAPQPTSNLAPPEKDASATNPTVEKNFRPSMAPQAIKARLSAAEKTRDKGPIAKTFVPHGFGSKAAKSKAKREDTGADPGIGASESKPDAPFRQGFAAPTPGTSSSLPSAQTKSPESKAVPRTGPDATARISPIKTMPSLAATMKWIGDNAPPAIEHDAPAKTSEMGQSNSPESSMESSMEKPPVPHGTEAASQRENKNPRIVRPMEPEVFSTRQSESPGRKGSQSKDGVPPVEVNVSIGHIEIKSVQPNPPAPRRAPQRPRFTLDEFLKHPHSGGPR